MQNLVIQNIDLHSISSINQAIELLNELSQPENNIDSQELAEILRKNDFIFRIGKYNLSISEKLQLLILKLLLILWEENKEEDLIAMEKKLQLIDDIRHELAFLRAKYYKEIFNQKVGMNF